MKNIHIESTADAPNAELQPGFEPLRIGFALFALLLGAAAALQF
jgi:hypothetical protein